MRELKKQFVMRWDELLTIFSLQLFLFLAGEVIVAVVVYTVKEETVVELGTLMALAGILLVLFFIGASVMQICFNMGISMCDVRKRLVPAIFFVTFLETMAAIGAAYLFHRLELWIFQTFYPGMENELDLGFLFQWKYILLAGLAFTAVYSLLGVLFIRYGKIAFWIFWVIWFLGCLGPSIAGKLWSRYRHTAVVRGISSVWSVFGQIAESAVLWGIAGAAVLILMISYFLLRRQQVNL